jgi:hypothetical protein
VHIFKDSAHVSYTYISSSVPSCSLACHPLVAEGRVREVLCCGYVNIHTGKSASKDAAEYQLSQLTKTAICMSLGKQNPFAHLERFNLSWRPSDPEHCRQESALTEISSSQPLRCDKFSVR